MTGFGGKITVTNSEYRPCLVNGKNALFHRWEDASRLVPPSPAVGGHPGGRVSGVLAIVEFEDGTVDEVPPSAVKFLDSDWLFREYCFRGDDE